MSQTTINNFYINLYYCCKQLNNMHALTVTDFCFFLRIFFSFWCRCVTVAAIAERLIFQGKVTTLIS